MRELATLGCGGRAFVPPELPEEPRLPGSSLNLPLKGEKHIFAVTVT